MAKTYYHDLILSSLGIIVLCILHANSQTPFRMYTLYTNSNYNNSRNLLYSGSSSTITDLACLLKCRSYPGCVIVVLTNNTSTISYRFYKGFFGILTPTNWLIYDPNSHLYLRGI